MLGIGLGWRGEEFEALGVRLADRVRRLEDSVAVYRQAWSGELVTGGEHLGLPRRARPPVAGAPGRPADLDRGDVRAGDPPRWTARRRLHGDRGYARDLGGAGPLDRARARTAPAATGEFTISVHLPTFAWRGRDAWERVRPYHWYVELEVRRHGGRARRAPSGPLGAAAPRRPRGGPARVEMVLGTPEQVAERLRAYREAAGGRLHYIARLLLPRAWSRPCSDETLAALRRAGRTARALTGAAYAGDMGSRPVASGRRTRRRSCRARSSTCPARSRSSTTVAAGGCSQTQPAAGCATRRRCWRASSRASASSGFPPLPRTARGCSVRVQPAPARGRPRARRRGRARRGPAAGRADPARARRADAGRLRPQQRGDRGRLGAARARSPPTSSASSASSARPRRGPPRRSRSSRGCCGCRSRAAAGRWRAAVAGRRGRRGPRPRGARARLPPTTHAATRPRPYLIGCLTAPGRRRRDAERLGARDRRDQRPRRDRRPAGEQLVVTMDVTTPTASRTRCAGSSTPRSTRSRTCYSLAEDVARLRGRAAATAARCCTSMTSELQVQWVRDEHERLGRVFQVGPDGDPLRQRLHPLPRPRRRRRAGGGRRTGGWCSSRRRVAGGHTTLPEHDRPGRAQPAGRSTR